MSSKDIRTLPCDQEFATRLSHAVAYLRKQKPGVVLAALLAVRGGETNQRQTESRWAGGVPDGARDARTPQILARVAAHLAGFSKVQAACLIESYIGFISDKKKTWHSAEKGLQSQGPRSSEEWVEFALYLHLLSLQGKYDLAHAKGTKQWSKARQGYDVPNEVFAIVRFAIFRAKQRCIADGRTEVIRTGILEPLGIARHVRASSYELVSLRDSPKLSVPDGFSLLNGSYKGHRDFLRSIEVDRLLLEGKMEHVVITDSQTPYEIPEDWMEFAAHVLKEKVCSSQEDIFDGAKVMPCKLPTLAQLQSGTLPIRQSSYFQSVCTGWSQEDMLQSTGNRDDQLSIGLDPDFLTKAANHIGVVTLAITRIGELIVVEQSKMNHQGAGKIVPFGGSAEFYDLQRVAREDVVGLANFVRFSMKRELCEELAIDRDLVKSVQILGQTLDSSRALHLDYHGVSFLDCEFEDVALNREHLYGGVLFSEQLDLTGPDQFLRSVEVATQKLCGGYTNKPHDFLKATLAYLAQAHEVVLERLHDTFRP